MDIPARYAIPAVLAVLAVVAALLYFLVKPPASVPAPQQLAQKQIIVGGSVVWVAVADTETSREKGLSGSEPLGTREGMLFIFDTDGTWGIWMKDMLFSIDIVWVDASGTVVTVARDVAPETYPEVFLPSSPVRYVLELPAGFAAARGIVEGGQIVL